MANALAAAFGKGGGKQRGGAGQPAGAAGSPGKGKGKGKGKGNAPGTKAATYIADGKLFFADGRPVAWKCWWCGELHANEAKQDCRSCGEVRLEHDLFSPGVAEHTPAAPALPLQLQQQQKVAEAQARRDAAVAGAAGGVQPKAKAKAAAKAGPTGPAPANPPAPAGVWAMAASAAAASAPKPATRKERRQMEAEAYEDEALKRYIPGYAPAQEPDEVEDQGVLEDIAEAVDEFDMTDGDGETEEGDPPADLEARRTFLTSMIAMLSMPGADPCRQLPRYKRDLEALPSPETAPANFLLDSQKLSASAERYSKLIEVDDKAIESLEAKLHELKERRDGYAQRMHNLRTASAQAAARHTSGIIQPLVPSQAPREMERLSAESCAHLVGTLGGTDPATELTVRSYFDRIVHEAWMAGHAASADPAPQAPATPIGEGSQAASGAPAPTAPAGAGT